ncbi:MAG: hypothetical protein JNK95_14185 [Candidatus Competibacter sp.]|nr:hypothetical protein [Candidatus Competibacter sp.]MDG4604976.1 hypothetical protein [Candidatus Contendobacter sp.]HRD49826.1 hypothetical protein [Candidatus Contendobacter sp.]
MNGQEQGQFTIYAAEAAIPRYQRAWVWGLAALAILGCGLAAGWLLGGAGAGFRDGTRPTVRSSVDSGALLTRQQAANQELRARIARLEQALRGDACGAAALETLLPPPAGR